MQEVKPNSHRYKEEQIVEAAERKKVDKVVTGAVKTKKKSEARQAFDTFVNEDLTNIKSYIVKDVIIPTIKNTIWDAFTNSLDMILFGGKGGNRSRPSNSSRSVPYVNYNKASSNRDNRNSSNSSQNRFNLDEIVLNSRGDAEAVLDSMRAIIREYDGLVTVGDLYDLLGETSDYTARNWGWMNLNNAEPVHTRDGWILKLPRPVPIEK